jgi:hypothetical protein
MTEAEWLSSVDPTAMLEFVQGKASDRKFRLFACVCCRSVWALIGEERWRKAVEVAEDYADQACSSERLKRDWDAEGVTAVGHAIDGATATDARWGADWAARNAVQAVAESRLRIPGPPNSGEKGEIRAWLRSRKEREQSIEHSERTIQTARLRDIFGNPFRPATFDPSWRTINVVGLAQTIYDERAFDKMPELGDALERAGCRNVAILSHCREPGEHVRGCWVVDVVLGKE